MANISHPLIDQSTSVQSIYTYVDSRVDTAKSRWAAFGDGAAAAYGSAHRSVQVTLAGCKAREQARIAAEAAAMTFVISLVTVGIGGAVAGTLISHRVNSALPKLAEGQAASLARKVFASALEQPFKRAADEATKLLDEGLKGVFVPTVSSNPFDVCGLSPTEYGETLKESIEAQFIVLCELKETLADAVVKSPQLVDSARATARKILDNPLMESQPAPATYSTVLRRPATAALWLAWGRRLDIRYWEVRGVGSGVPHLVSPNLDFSPILGEMNKLGFGPRVSSKAFMGIGQWYEPVIDMYKFATWSRTIAGFDETAALVPAGLRKSDWFAKARFEFMKKNCGPISAFMT